MPLLRFAIIVTPSVTTLSFRAHALGARNLHFPNFEQCRFLTSLGMTIWLKCHNILQVSIGPLHPETPLPSVPHIRRHRFGGRRLASSLLGSHHQFGNGRQLHVGSAFVDLADLGIAPVFLHRIILGEAVPAVDFDGQRGHPLGHL